MTPVITKLILALADGEACLLEELAEFCDIDVSEMPKQLLVLERFGLAYEYVDEHQVKLTRAFQRLVKNAIKSNLRETLDLDKIEVFSTVDSTNTYLLNQELTGESWRVFLAEHQSAGRGRRNHEWISAYGAGIYLSLARAVETKAFSGGGFSLVVGLAVSQVLSELGVEGVQLKWPNDILFGQRKLGGVLVETKVQPEGKTHVVIGIGLNIHMPYNVGHQGRMRVALPPAALVEADPRMSQERNMLVAKIINKVTKFFDEFMVHGLPHFLAKWKDVDALKGVNVRAIAGEEVLEGCVIGIDEKGALLLRVGEQTHAIRAGEVSVRPLLASFTT